MTQIRPTVYTALFVALIACGAFIAIPIGPVPIVLQNMFVLLAGLMLGPMWGLACVGVYLIIGLAGLPVFAGATAGVGKLFGPTGGYLLGYLPAVGVTAVVSRGLQKTLAGDLAALVLGSLIVYAAGVPWLKVVTGMDWAKAFALGMYPFLIGDGLKIVAAALIAKKMRPLMHRQAGQRIEVS
ncbi:MAG TPA: BioY family transporter [Desulfobacteraceae bacterium]|nr:BioY family transporter [Desulfobacteraceae bacterium]